MKFWKKKGQNKIEMDSVGASKRILTPQVLFWTTGGGYFGRILHSKHIIYGEAAVTSVLIQADWQ